jgi:RNA polymerase sigma-70 factor (ECF subfamily)
MVGQSDDYVDLYRQYLPRIHSYVRLRVDDEAVAQDLTAEVFERAVSRQHTLRRKEAFGAWLFAIARNAVAGFYRRRRPTVSLDKAGHQSAPEPLPPEVVIRREEVARLKTAMEILSDREQEILRLKFGGGLGNKEIGDIMSLQPGNVAVIVYRALRKLRAEMEGES